MEVVIFIITTIAIIYIFYYAKKNIESFYKMFEEKLNDISDDFEERISDSLETFSSNAEEIERAFRYEIATIAKEFKDESNKTNKEIMRTLKVIPSEHEEKRIRKIEPLINDILYKMDFGDNTGILFENMVCMILKENGFKDIKTTRATGDYGVDILAEKDQITYAIQCKCYSNPVGNKAVQEAFSGKQYYNRMVASVITNNVFTPNAVETAKRTNVLLWDRKYLESLMLKMEYEQLAKILQTSTKTNFGNLVNSLAKN